jgi:NADH dehydrogenase (ubiquinone) 1 alpha subcomplex subunit 5
VKESTGITGLPVVPNAREVLLDLYQETLRQIAKLPNEAAYRHLVEKMVNHRLQILQSESDYEVIEEKIGQGQLEELIQAAKDELQLIPKMLEWKPWEVDSETKDIPIIILNQTKEQV